MHPLALLKQETQQAHLRLEQALNLLRPDMTRASYVLILQRFYGFWLPWEELVGPVLSEALPGFFERRRRAAAIAADLCYLGTPLDAGHPLPRCGSLPAIDSPGAAFGSMYVIEGSTLGGQLLARHFRETLDLKEEGNRFFGGYADQTGAMWREFGRTLESRPAGEHPAMVSAAIQTFQELHAWLAPSI